MPIPLATPALAAALLIGGLPAHAAAPSVQLQDLRGPAGSPAPVQGGPSKAASAARAGLGNGVHGRLSSSVGGTAHGGRSSSGTMAGAHGGTSAAVSMEIHGAPSSSTRPHVTIGEIRSLLGLPAEAAADATIEPAGEDRKPRTVDGGLKKEKDALFAADAARGGSSSTLQGG